MAPHSALRNRISCKFSCNRIGIMLMVRSRRWRGEKRRFRCMHRIWKSNKHAMCIILTLTLKAIEHLHMQLKIMMRDFITTSLLVSFANENFPSSSLSRNYYHIQMVVHAMLQQCVFFPSTLIAQIVHRDIRKILKICYAARWRQSHVCLCYNTAFSVSFLPHF